MPQRITAELAATPALVEAEQVQALQELLADVAAGRAQVVQAGDCAEDLADCVPSVLGRKVQLLARLGDIMTAGCGLPTHLVGRIAGQFAKPRSSAVELCDGVCLPVFRGLLVNRPEPDLTLRRADPRRLLAARDAAGDAVRFLADRAGDRAVWTSHEALVLDYEVPLLRVAPDGGLLLASTHWPWIGDRTRGPDDAHVRLLAAVGNPVACKVGPTMTEAELLRLCEQLDPERVPGRLTLISRLGAGRAAERLPALIGAVRAKGHPVIWLCDPMHANTVITPSGLKTRLLTAISQEVREFRAATEVAGAPAGGLHLEATADDVVECVGDQAEAERLGAGSYRSLCDPRLNEEQAVAIAALWTETRRPV